MAVLTDVPGLVVTIDIAGQDLPEYNDDEAEDQPPHTATKYVEAQSGAHFGIARRYTSATFPHSNDFIQFRLYLDGKWVGQWSDTPQHIATTRRMVSDYMESTHEDKSYSQKFAFAELEISEGPADKSLMGKLTELGTISIRCFRFKYGEPQPARKIAPAKKTATKARSKKAAPLRRAPPPPPFEGSQKPVLENDVVPEKNLKGKAISHQAKLAAPVEQQRIHTPAPDTRPIIMIDTTPFATFNFVYRSRSALQSLCVIPRSPSPVPLEARPIEELTPEEMRELLRRQKEQLEKGSGHVKVKQEIKNEGGRTGGDEAEDELEIVGHRRKKRRTSGPGVADNVVNLSDDD